MSEAVRAREFEFTLPVGYVDDEGAVHRAVVLRKMTGREEAILADRRYQRNGGKLVSRLLASCIVRLGDVPRPQLPQAVAKLYSADRNFLLLKLRTITFGPELEARYSCPHCGEAVNSVENLDELPVRALQNGHGPDEILLELEDGYLDREGQVHTAITLRLPTGADEEAVADQTRRNASEGKNALLARCLLSLGDLPKNRMEAIGPRILSDLTLTDRRMIDRAINEQAPGVDLIREIECIECGDVFRTTVDLSHFLALE